MGSKFVYYTSLEDAERYLRFSFASVLLYLVHMFMVKAAFLGIYWGVFQHLDNRRKMVYISVAVITGATFLASMLLQGLWCVVKGWLVYDKNFYCVIIHNLPDCPWTDVSTFLYALGSPAMPLPHFQFSSSPVLQTF